MNKALFTLIVSWGLLQRPAAAWQQLPQELVQYVRDARKAGLNDGQIQQNATKAGWPAADISSAIAMVSSGGAASGQNAAAKAAPAPAEGADPAAGGTPAVKPPEQPASASEALKPPAATPPPAAQPTASQPTTDTTVKPSSKPDRGVPDEYEIGAGDVLHVAVWKEPEASVPSVVVRPDGKISMPMIKEVRVVGLTPSQAEKTIAEQLSKFISGADVTVVVTSINSKKIYFVGAVKREGPMALTYRMTIMQAISEAGGLTDYAKKKKIYILHQENGREFKIPFDYNAVLRGEHMEQNLTLTPGDTIVVPK